MAEIILREDASLGKKTTTRVLRRISLLIRSRLFVVRIDRRCSKGNQTP
jgi:hypothetical protein